MEELHAEGLATHGDPESCVDDPHGRGEALTGARGADRQIWRGELRAAVARSDQRKLCTR
jgi:hypothetical protein